MENSLSQLLENTNIAQKLSEQRLKEIGTEAYAGYEMDRQSRMDWEKNIDEWTKLAKQTVETKTYPWPRASNVKYPVLSTAAMQFAARAYPSLVPSNGRIVNARPIGKDPDGKKAAVAEAVSLYMSYQLLQEMDSWEEEMDKMLLMLPIVGTTFKKTYWDNVAEKNCSRLVMPKNLVINYWAKSLKEAERITEIIELSPRKVKERQQSGVWLDVGLGSVPSPEGIKNAPSVTDTTTPYTFLEQHSYLDLDDDGYQEPYIITLHKETKKVVRITARYNETTIKMDSEGNLKKIDAIQYYTKYGFIPNPDGSFYDIGFGVLLGPLNESVNTVINQLLDSGHLSTLQAGFIGKGLRIKLGDTKFLPGEWKVVNALGADLKQQILPLPTKEPSDVLFQLMGSLITSGKELASVAEIFVGKMPGQNTPATTTMATIEQGMKVFTAVYKRIFRSLTEEFQKLARLNNLYTNPETYADVVDVTVNPDDFDLSKHNIIPGADPTAVSQTEKLLKAQGLMELLPTGMLNPVKVVKRVLEAQEQPNWEELLNQQVAETGQPPQQPDPKMLELQMKGQLEQQKIGMQSQAQQHKLEIDARSEQVKLAMKAQEHALDMQHKEDMAKIQAAEALHKQRIFEVSEKAKVVQNIQHTEAQHQQKLQHAQQEAKQKAKEPSKGVKK